MTSQTLTKKPTLNSEKDVTLSEWEKQQASNARNRARIMQILKDFPKGLTVQQIIAQEIEYFGYSFLTDNRLRELRAKSWVVSEGEKPQIWKVVSGEVEQSE